MGSNWFEKVWIISGCCNDFSNMGNSHRFYFIRQSVWNKLTAKEFTQNPVKMIQIVFRWMFRAFPINFREAFRSFAIQSLTLSIISGVRTETGLPVCFSSSSESTIFVYDTHKHLIDLSNHCHTLAGSAEMFQVRFQGFLEFYYCFLFHFKISALIKQTFKYKCHIFVIFQPICLKFNAFDRDNMYLFNHYTVR